MSMATLQFARSVNWLIIAPSSLLAFNVKTT